MDPADPVGAAEDERLALHDDDSTSPTPQQSVPAAAAVAALPWVGTQLRVTAVTGLASSHSAPFVRVLYQMPRRSKKKTNKSNKVICLNNEALASSRDHRLRREQNGRFTAIWSDSAGEEEFVLPPALDFVEIQVWNQFPNGFDVFLGMAALSIASLYQQQQRSHSQQETLAASAILQTPLMWIPLQATNENQHSASAGRAQMNLSIELQVSFLCDAKASRIKQQVAQRAKRKQENHSRVPDTSIADPAFAFTEPFQTIDWSAVVATSVRHIFFHADVERLSSFQDQVLYGDLIRELDEDPGLHVHDDHVKAFQLSQLSAQYLSHCVETLAGRCEEYSDQYRVLADTHSSLFRTRSQLKRQRDRLEKESLELDLLLSTYKSLADKEQLGFPPEEQKPSISSPVKQSSSANKIGVVSRFEIAAPGSPIDENVVSQKPAFLMTWEEREREKKLEKEKSKAQRIEEEKQRLEQRTLERKLKEEHDQKLSSLLNRGRERAATTIQRFLRLRSANDKRQQSARAWQATTRIQSRLRGFVCRSNVYPKLMEQHRCARELGLMSQNESEMRALVHEERQLSLKMAQNEEIQEPGLPVKSPLSPPLLRQDVSALVAVYRKLKRIFTLAAAAAGEDEGEYELIFAKLDLRRDGFLDRAEFRLGIRSFGVRIDRKLTRALIALLKAKCGLPPQPLHLTLSQFVQGFDLPVGSSPTDDHSGAVSASRGLQGDDAELVERLTPRKAPQESKQDGDDGDAAEDQLTLVSQAVETLRRKILDAARAHLEAQGKKKITDYRDFRSALSFVFEEFDTNKNGELDLDEFVACIESIHFPVTKENLTLLKDCFDCGDAIGDTKISIAEFISFALAGLSSSSGQAGDTENLGIVGSRLREAVLERVKAARKQHAESIEDAVRFVFKRAYPRKNQQTCSVPVLLKALSKLQLNVKSAQLARLVAKLDKDGDKSISFDELLLWLRLRSANDVAGRNPILGANGQQQSPESTVRRRSHITKASATAKLVRSVLHQLAGLGTSSNSNNGSSSSRRPALTTLFAQIDRDGSKKVTRDEIQGFMASQSPLLLQNALALTSQVARDGSESELTTLLPSSSDSQPAALAEMIVHTIDLNRNGVVTLDEWLEFLDQGDANRGDSHVDRFALVNSVRAALHAAISDEADLIAWFHNLPGALPAPSTSASMSTGELKPSMKVRVGVFKTALRSKLGAKSISLPLQAIDEAVKRLDSDSSGWITTTELQAWAFPIRDLEEIVRAITSRWKSEQEASAEAQQDDETSDFALRLYGRFDADGNGVLAQREIRGGLASFGLNLKIEEVASLTKAFDLDKDGCWSKAEFLAFVYSIFPQSIFPTSTSNAGDSLEAEAKTEEAGGRETTGANGLGENAGDEDDYEKEGFLSSRSSEASSAAASPPHRSSSQHGSPASSTTGSRAGDYSADFDKDDGHQSVSREGTRESQMRIHW